MNVDYRIYVLTRRDIVVLAAVLTAAFAALGLLVAMTLPQPAGRRTAYGNAHPAAPAKPREHSLRR